MNYSNDTIQHEFNKLDVGYYLGAYIPVTLDVDGNYETSIFDPINWQIVIAVNNVHAVMANVSGANQQLLEKTLRCVLYHEVSHAIKTPKSLIPLIRDLAPSMSMNGSELHNIVNIFEDERIETLLKNFYIKVNFKENIMSLCGWDPRHPTEPKDPLDMFFQVVRFRWGNAKLVNQVQKIINQFTTINAITTNRFDTLTRYIYEIKDLYDACKDEFKNRQQPQSSRGQDQQTQGGQNNEGESQNGEGKSIESKDGSEETSSNDNQQQEEANQASQSGNAQSQTQEDAAKKQAEAIRKLVRKLKADAKKIDSGVTTPQHTVTSMIAYMSRYKDAHYTNQMITMFNEFEARIHGETSARLGYSGKIMPRLFATRNDYKVFEHESTEGDIMRYASLHLTLVIDDSGSMDINVNNIRTLLASLSECERRCKKFSYDYITNGSEAILHDKRDLLYEANGGSDIDERLDGMIKSTYKQNAVNKVLVLMDGDMLQHAPGGRHSGKYRLNYAKLFELFNYDNYILIVDPSNSSYLKYCPKAKTIVCKNYVEEFRKEIIRQLNIQCRL